MNDASRNWSTHVSNSESQITDENLPLIEATIDAFLQAWEDSPTPPSIIEYVDACEDRLRHRTAIELVKIDLELRWRCGLRRLIEDYVDEIPDLKDRITPHLVLEEFHARRSAGDSVTTREYFERFPQFATSLKGLMSVDPLLASTTMNDLTVPLRVQLNPGETIDDFDLLLILGRGAFATVFLARQRSMQRIVAVKVSADRGDEPQTLAQLDHDNIVRIYDQRAVPDRGLRLLYMQYAAGGTLSSVLHFLRGIPRGQWNGKQYLKAIDRELDLRGESAPTESSIRQKVSQMTWPQVVCWIGAQLSHALEYAHRNGVLHRDIKPANVLLTADGVPKLADFNISFSKNITGAAPAAYFGGSLAYMSLEQLEVVDNKNNRTADSLDGRSDLFSLGVVIWELLTGELPFPDDLDSSGRYPRLDAMIQHRRDGIETNLSHSRREDLGLSEVAIRCLAPGRDERFQTGLELAKEFELCLLPEARELLMPAPGGWKPIAKRHAQLTIVILTLIPNLTAAIFNFLYNHGEIMKQLAGAEPTFMRIQAIINSIAFPAGILSSGWLVGSVAKATRINSRNRLTPSELTEQRRRCLNLGNVAAGVGLTLWLIAAPVYPISLHLMLGSVPAQLYVQFLASLTLCGLIAAAYPFFAVTFVAVRCFYPALVDWGTMSDEDRAGLKALGRQTWIYLALAACVPMMSIVVLALTNPGNYKALIVLAAGGMFGFGIALTAFGLIQRDLSTLVRGIWREER